MKLTALALALASFVFPCLLAAQPNPSPQDVAKSLEKHSVILRHYYTDTKLKFDSNGQLVSKATEGFGPSDGRVYVQEVQLLPNKLLISGTRLIDVYNAQQDKWGARDIGRKTSIDVDLPTDTLPESAVPHLLNTIFLKSTETMALQCSGQEQQECQNDILKLFTGEVESDLSKLPVAGSLTDVPKYCLPGGERAYRVGRGIKAPRAKHTPDPHYSEAARHEGFQGTAVLMVVVATDGLPSAISIVRSICANCDDKHRRLGQQLDQAAVQAVSKWKFEPAKFGDTPVPVVIKVEVNFRLY